LNIRVVHLNSSEVFNSYAESYRIDKNLYQPELLALEINNLPEDFNDLLRKKQEFSFLSGNSFLSIGHLKDFKKMIRKIGESNAQFADEVLKTLNNYENYDNLSYSIGNKIFNFNKCYIMGILNATPDSFSDGGKYFTSEKGVEHALEMIEKGADIIDVGGESTRPGAKPVSPEEELKRVIPVIEQIIKFKNDAVVSIDTTKSIVAEAALNAGASIINDISGLVFDKKIADVASIKNAAVVIMHIKGTPLDMQKNPFYNDVTAEVYEHLKTQTETAEKAGIKKIFIDPGIGFGKRMEDNFTILKRLKDFKSLGYPVMIGLSRKAFIGKHLNLGINERDNATAVAESMAVMNGARIIRTHNVENGMYVKELFNRIT
jgi:dihydropteroate synthase